MSTPIGLPNPNPTPNPEQERINFETYKAALPFYRTFEGDPGSKVLGWLLQSCLYTPLQPRPGFTASEQALFDKGRASVALYVLNQINLVKQGKDKYERSA